MTTESMQLRIEDGVAPHNGTPEYQIDVRAKDPLGVWLDPEGDYIVRGLGGQRLLIARCMQYSRFIAPVGRRFGKTTSIPFLLWEESRYVHGMYYAMVISPSHDKAVEVKEYCEGFFGDAVVNKVGGPKDQRRYLEILPLSQPDGSVTCKLLRVYFVSGAHPHYKRLRGYPHHMNRVIADEFAQSHPLMRKVIMPMLADHGGSFLAIGTTDEDEQGNDIFLTYYERGQDELDPEYATWGCMNFPTHANPHLSEEGIRALEADCVTQEDYDQEILAKFLQGRGAVFQELPVILTLEYTTDRPAWASRVQAKAIAALGDNLRREAADPPDMFVAEADPDPTHYYILSIDWAKERDHTIMRVFNQTLMQDALLVRFNGQNWTEQFVWSSEIAAHYNCVAIHGDANTGAGQAMHERLAAVYKNGVMPHRFNVYNKGEYVRDAEILFYEHRIKLIACPQQYTEFRAYKRFMPESEKGTVHVRYGHPPGKNDDFVDTLLQIAPTLIRTGQIKARTVGVKRGYNIIDKEGKFDMDVVVSRFKRRQRMSKRKRRVGR